jgi:methionine biosynthesis protein MetW
MRFIVARLAHCLRQAVVTSASANDSFSDAEPPLPFMRADDPSSRDGSGCRFADEPLKVQAAVPAAKRPNWIARIPVLRALLRYWREVFGPAPYNDFSDYDDYWKARIRDDRRPGVLHRHVWVAHRIPAGASVLDIGCGDGAFLRYLRQKNPEARIVGADVAETAVVEIRKLGIECFHISGDVPLADQLSSGWDAVVLMEVIEHVHDAEGLMRQVMAMNPARILVTLPNVGFLIHRIRLAFGGRFPVTTIIYHMKEHIRFWTVKDFHQWATYLGLEVTAYQGQMQRPDPLVRLLVRLWPSLFASQMIYELKPSLQRNERASRAD